MGQLEKKVQKKTFRVLESLEVTEEEEELETLRDSVKSESEEAGKHYRKFWDEVKETNFRNRMESFLQDLKSFSHSPPPRPTQKPMFGFKRRMVAMEKKTVRRSFRILERVIEEVVEKEDEIDATIHQLGNNLRSPR